MYSLGFKGVTYCISIVMWVPLEEYKGNRINDGSNNDDDDFLHYYFPLKRNVSKDEYIQLVADSEQRQKEQRIEWDRTYREKNKDKIKERRHVNNDIRYNCNCGSNVSLSNKYKHNKSNKHQLWITKNNQEQQEVRVCNVA